MSHYERLGVRRSASADEIRAAYRRRVKELHPDLPANNPAAGGRDTTEEMAKVNAAFEILIDSDRRGAYDLELPTCHVNSERVATWTDTYRFVESLGHERLGQLFRTHPEVRRDHDLFWRHWREEVRRQRRAKQPFDVEAAYAVVAAAYHMEV